MGRNRRWKEIRYATTRTKKKPLRGIFTIMKHGTFRRMYSTADVGVAFRTVLALMVLVVVVDAGVGAVVVFSFRSVLLAAS